MGNYYCWYEFYDRHADMKRRQFVVAESIWQIEGGFWINDQNKITNGSDCVWWIPPSAILIVEKV